MKNMNGDIMNKILQTPDNSKNLPADEQIAELQQQLTEQNIRSNKREFIYSVIIGICFISLMFDILPWYGGMSIFLLTCLVLIGLAKYHEIEWAVVYLERIMEYVINALNQNKD